MTKIRTRFAPSPTGFLHIGGLRTALFAYLTAKSQGGDFILRIEDTDQSRQVEGADKKLIEIFEWIGLPFDEGPKTGGDFGPYVQSERRAIYDKYKEELLKKGKAYHCFCTAERLQSMREEQQARKEAPRYDRRCRDLSQAEVDDRLKKGERFVIRQKMPLDGDVIVNDALRGDIKFRAQELEDHVLIKTDGMPTYQFASVVDDHLMEISHVTRTEEWLPSFPKNILLYNDFGWTPPIFIHFPVVLNKGGGKLSKRQGDVAVEDYRDKGYLQEALINFNALLGWHPKDDNEILSLDDLVKQFDYKTVGTSPAVFDVEKLDYFNGYYIRHKNIDELITACLPYLQDNINKTEHEYKKDKEFLKKVVGLEQERLKKLSEIGEYTEFLFVDDLAVDAGILPWKKMTNAETKENLLQVAELIDSIPDKNWTNDSIEDAIVTYLKAKELRIGEYLWPLRVALTGKKASPGPFEVAEILGKAETLKRISQAVSVLK
jgi:glutamyl-tRNA synthetase